MRDTARETAALIGYSQDVAMRPRSKARIRPAAALGSAGAIHSETPPAEAGAVELAANTISRSPIMAAWLGGDIPGAIALAEAVGESDPAYPAARALLLGVAFDDGRCTVAEARAAHERALSGRIDDVDLRGSLLRNLAHFLIAANRIADARRVMRELEGIDTQLHPRLRLAAPATRWRLARAEDDYPGELAAVERGFDVVDRQRVMPAERVGLSRLILHWQRLQSALANHDLRRAERDVAAVRANAGHALQAGWWDWHGPEAMLMELTGQYDRGLARLAQMPADIRRKEYKTLDVIEATLLIRAGRLADADRIIDQLSQEAAAGAGESEGPAEVAEVDVAWLGGLRSMATGDLVWVWEAAEVMARATRRDHPTWAGRASGLLIDASLATGRTALARRLLEGEDPDRAKARYRVAWARLHWQEGDHAAGAEVLSRVLTDVLPDYPGYLARQMQYAMEMSAYELARMWAMAVGWSGGGSTRQAGGAEAGGASAAAGRRGKNQTASRAESEAEIEAPAGGAADSGLESSDKSADALDSGTLGRRWRLLRLFDQHRRLTRAQVSALLGCSPNTATRDLAALMEEGTVKRVETSAHLRTSYFVRAGGGKE